MVKPQFVDLLSSEPTFNTDLVNELIGGRRRSTTESTEAEKALSMAREKSERNRKRLQEVMKSWVTGSRYPNLANKRIVGGVLENWDKP
jgi:hypothetical protein